MNTALRLTTETESVRPAISEVATRIGKMVRHLRLECGFTQADLAAHAGVTQETVARLERVVRERQSANFNPSLETLVRLAHALCVDVKELVA